MKNEETIFLSDALKIMTERLVNGQFRPFNLVVRTFNSQTYQGGKIRVFEGARYLPSANSNKKLTAENVIKNTNTNRPPNHFTNRTRNIELQDNSVRKVRIDFIISINNKKVIY